MWKWFMKCVMLNKLLYRVRYIIKCLYFDYDLKKVFVDFVWKDIKIIEIVENRLLRIYVNVRECIM